MDLDLGSGLSSGLSLGSGSGLGLGLGSGLGSGSVFLDTQLRRGGLLEHAPLMLR